METLLSALGKIEQWSRTEETFTRNLENLVQLTDYMLARIKAIRGKYGPKGKWTFFGSPKKIPPTAGDTLFWEELEKLEGNIERLNHWFKYEISQDERSKRSFAEAKARIAKYTEIDRGILEGEITRISVELKDWTEIERLL